MSMEFCEDDRRFSRFSDINEESFEDLLPLEGYESMPLVRLREAIRPVAHLFVDIYTRVDTAEKSCENPDDGLTQDESASIFLYTMSFPIGPSFYSLLNEALRNAERQYVRPWFLYLKLFLTAVNKLESHNTKVWRSVPNVDFHSQFFVGQQITWWGISSCSQLLSVMEDKFLHKIGLRTLFNIECLYGKNIASHSNFPDEREFILLPGSQFTVTDISNPADDLYIIMLEQIPILSKRSLVSISSTESNLSQSIQSFNAIPQTNLYPIVTYSNNSNEPTVMIQKCNSESNDNCKQIKLERKYVLLTICIILLLTLSIVALIIAYLYEDDCPIEKWIPRWLTIFSFIGLSGFGFVTFINFFSPLYCLKKLRCIFRFSKLISSLLLLCWFAWSIPGSIWLFSHHSTVSFNRTNKTSNYCDKIIYNFTLGTLITVYSLIILMCCCGLSIYRRF